MGKVWWLHVSYDEKSDEFFAYVADEDHKSSIFQIDDTDEMCSYIETGVMKHIDDVDGLTVFLRKQQYIQEGDMIKLNEELMW